jgi:hypothetical protein
MRKGLVLAGVGSLLVMGGIALAQTPGDPFGEVLKESGPRPAPPVVVEPTPVPDIPPDAVNDVPKPDAPPVADHAETIPTLPPDKRPRYPIAIVQALDKITTETMRFEAPVGQPVRYKNLIFTVRSCEATAADEDERDAIAHVEVLFAPQAAAGQTPVAAKTIFRGWMFAASPSISPLEHPTYDAWLIACKANTPIPSPAPVRPAAPKVVAPPPPALDDDDAPSEPAKTSSSAPKLP